MLLAQKRRYLYLVVQTSSFIPWFTLQSLACTFFISIIKIDGWDVACYWEDPHTFGPSQFINDWQREAFVPFSAGQLTSISLVYVWVHIKFVLINFIGVTDRLMRMSLQKVRLFETEGITVLTIPPAGSLHTSKVVLAKIATQAHF
jgi:hypothetical protein